MQSDNTDGYELHTKKFPSIFDAYIKVACTSGPIFEKNMKRYPIFSLQIIYYQIVLMHK